MPASAPELDRLDSAHRAQQNAIAAAAALGVLQVWSEEVTYEDILDGATPSIERFLTRSTPLILRANQRSALAGTAYFERVRTLQVPDAPRFDPGPVDLPPVAAIRKSLYITGVIGAQKRIEKIPEGPGDIPKSSNLSDFLPPNDPRPLPFSERQVETIRAGRQARIESVLVQSGEAAGAAAFRHTMNGGRGAVKEHAQRDPRALGYVRITRGDADVCYFCAMLASRGRVFTEESFDASDPRFEGTGNAKVHDSCRCCLRAIYTRKREEIPDFNWQMHELWHDRSKWPKERTTPINDWRKMYAQWARR